MMRGSNDKMAFWRAHVAKWSTSGLSRAAYCKKCDLSDATMKYWLERLKTIPDEGAFVPVTSNSGASIKITLANGTMIHCEQNVGLTWLKNLVGTLQNQ